MSIKDFIVVSILSKCSSSKRVTTFALFISEQLTTVTTNAKK